jgi:hypothetical protein
MFSKSNLAKTAAQNQKNNQHEDITGTYPTIDYVGAFNYSKEALGNKRTELYYNGAIDGIPIDNTDLIQSEYPLNQVQKSFSGHSFEMDDTPGAERIIIKHTTGAGVEIGKDGSISISTIKNSIQVTGGDQFITITGDGTINYGGNLELNVTGDFNINCMNFNVKTRGNKTENISGFSKSKSLGQENIVNGPSFEVYTQQVTELMLANHDHMVKGISTHLVENDLKTFVGGNLYMTTEGILAQSADDMNLSANNMTVQGGTGIIGGTAVDFVGNGAVFDQGVKAPTFHGDLTGRADEAISADTSVFAATAGAAPTGLAGAAEGWTNTNTAVPANIEDVNAANYAVPDASSVTEYLTKLNGGIRKVKVDNNNYIKNKIDPKVDTGGILYNIDEVTPDLIRSRLRNKKNAENKAFLEFILKNQLINNSYFEEKTPAGYGRSTQRETSPVVGTTSFGPSGQTNTVSTSTKIPTKNIIPDPEFNYLNLGDITSRTKLSKNITMATFLGTKDPTNIDFIRDQEVKRQIAKYLTIHANILEIVNNEKTLLKNLIVKPVESIYRPGEFEIFDTGSDTDLKIKGRLVIYDIVDKTTGKSNPTQMYDLAVFLKDRIPFDIISLEYDNINIVDDEYNARMAIYLPELNQDYQGDFKQKINTKFNGEIVSQNEFIELQANKKEITPIPYTEEIKNNKIFDYKVSIKNSTIDRKYIKDQWVLRNLSDNAEEVLLKILENEFSDLMSLCNFQIYTTPQGILPKTKGSRKTTSQHLKGKAFDISVAGWSNDQKKLFINNALTVGFQGFGFYPETDEYNFIHIDMGPARWWKATESWAGDNVLNDWVPHINKNRKRENPYLSL